MNDVTSILSAIEQGDPTAAAELLPLVYGELRRLAKQRLAQEKPGQTLQATALVHEAYLRLVGNERSGGWDSRGSLLRRGGRSDAPHPGRQRPPQGGGEARRPGWSVKPSTLSTSRPRPPPRNSWPSTRRSRGSRPTTRSRPSSSSCGYFAGFSDEEAAQALGISRTTAHRHWRYARVWLLNELGTNEEPQENRRKPTGP